MKPHTKAEPQPFLQPIDARRRRLAAGLALAGLAAAAPAGAQQQSPATPVRKPAHRAWRFLINEAVTGESNLFILTTRYKPLADYVTEQVKGRPTIGIEPVVDIQRFISLAQGQPRPELVFGKSVNQLAKLVRDSGYQPLVRRADPYKAAFIVAKDSPIKTLADASKAKAKIIMPDAFAATTAVARAELRRQNVGEIEIVHTKFQEAVAQQIKNGFGQVGVVNPTTARKWVEEGGRVLAETQPVVNWSLLASPTLAHDEVQRLREALMAMNSQPTLMNGLGVKEWALADKKDYLALLDYTKE
ncbi:MAG TPA: PhnD/SsuA/transferrin family substrate-binding protein [Ramlibacter sp.]|nr:PhnD/SsuA/transferrin family substrate-binding protein [Ramlibacter sp.]